MGLTLPLQSSRKVFFKLDIWASFCQFTMDTMDIGGGRDRLPRRPSAKSAGKKPRTGGFHEDCCKCVGKVNCLDTISYILQYLYLCTEQLRKTDRQITRTQRDMERERANLQKEEKKLVSYNSHHFIPSCT